MISVIDKLRTYYGSAFDEDDDDVSVFRHWLNYGLLGWFKGGGPKAFEPFTSQFIGQMPLESLFFNFIKNNLSDVSQPKGRDKASFTKAMINLLMLPNFYQDDPKAFKLLVSIVSKLEGDRAINSFKTLLSQPKCISVKFENGLTLYRLLVSSVFESHIASKAASEFYFKALEYLDTDPTVFRLIAPRLISSVDNFSEKLEALTALNKGYIYFQNYIAITDAKFALQDIIEIREEVKLVLGNEFLRELKNVTPDQRNVIRNFSMLEGVVPPDRKDEALLRSSFDRDKNWRRDAQLNDSDIMNKVLEMEGV